MASCGTDTARELACRDSEAASYLKIIATIVILLTSVIGISAPILLARYFQGKAVYDKSILLIKCFAAGVILSTSLVHVLPDAFAALGDCQLTTRHTWSDFPFAGFVTLVGALLALLVDITASEHAAHGHGSSEADYKLISMTEEGKRIEKIEGGVGDRSERENEEILAKIKQRLVSQVLEIGIVFHSVIIGVTMGMSQNKCTIRPLVTAIAFHQVFEGMGLGGCIAQAGFSIGTVAYMCLMFSITTPIGIILGMTIYSWTGYDDNSPNALIMEGLLGSLSSGILIYMGLVDLIALDFFHNKLMTSHLKKISFMVLTIGSISMSILALWA